MTNHICKGGNCPIKDNCKLFTVLSMINGIEPPFKISGNKFKCTEYKPKKLIGNW